MSMETHLESLRQKHAHMEREIEEALAHPSVDDLEITELKRRKLRLKEEIERLATPPTHH